MLVPRSFPVEHDRVFDLEVGVEMPDRTISDGPCAPSSTEMLSANLSVLLETPGTLRRCTTPLALIHEGRDPEAEMTPSSFKFLYLACTAA